MYLVSTGIFSENEKHKAGLYLLWLEKRYYRNLKLIIVQVNGFLTLVNKNK
jgi:hypothetical protein